jgi:hypothetical protein
MTGGDLAIIILLFLGWAVYCSQAYLTLIYLVGLEGTGHHRVLPLLQAVVAASPECCLFLWPDDGLMGLTDLYKPALLSQPKGGLQISIQNAAEEQFP